MQRSISVLAGLLFFTLQLFGQIPRTISYQGVLCDAAGNPKPDNTYEITFRLYEAETGGAAIWTETKSLAATRGLFSTLLGSQEPFGSVVTFDRPYWLSIQVAAEAELSPRIALSSVGSSLRTIVADTAAYARNIKDGIVTTAKIGDGAVTGGKVAAGQVVRSVNALKDDVTLAPGANVTITPTGNTLTISASSGPGGTITGVTAGTGLTGGGTGGNVMLNVAVPLSLSGSSETPTLAGHNAGSGSGVFGQSVGWYGVYGTSASSAGVFGTSASSAGVSGESIADGMYGVYGKDDNGYGVVGVSTVAYGVYGYGGSYGVYGESEANIGVYGSSGAGTGVYAYSPGGSALYCYGKFYQDNGAFEAHPTSTTWSTNKPATVKLNNGSKVRLFAEEAAEVYFTDYGEGMLTNGKAHVELDPTFLQTVSVDARHPLRVFVQPNDDCKGLFVPNRGTAGFDVVEQQNGTSNAHFTYRVVCKRKYYEDERLAGDEEDIGYNTRMLQTVWPEVIAQQQAEREKMKTSEEAGRALKLRGVR